MIVAEDFAFAIFSATRTGLRLPRAIPPSMALKPDGVDTAARSVATRRLFTLPQ